MHSKEERAYTIILKSVLIMIALLLVALNTTGCKGKEEKQSISESPSSQPAEQQGKETAPMSPGSSPPVQSSSLQ
jgi:hypothetical protein